MQREGHFAWNNRVTTIASFTKELLEKLGSGLEGFQEGLFLGHSHGADTLPVLLDFWVGRGHRLTDRAQELLDDRSLGAQQAGRANDAANETTQDVAAALVAWSHAVENEHQRGTAVVSDDAEADVVLVLRAVAGAGQLLGGIDHRAQQVSLVDVVHTLQQECEALHAHAGIDVLLRQVAHDVEAAVGLGFATLELHEHEVPDLDESAIVHCRATVFAISRAAVVVDLGARPTRSGHTHVPVVILHPEALDTLGWQTDKFVPQLRGLVVVLVDGDPEAVRVQSKATVVDGIGQQRPRILDRAFLEVLAEGEIAGHLEEGVVAGGNAHLVDVEGSHALLDGGGGTERRGLLAQEVGLEGDHTRVDEEQVRVVEDQRRAGHLGVTAFHEMVGEALANLMRLHGCATSICLGLSRRPWWGQPPPAGCVPQGKLKLQMAFYLPGRDPRTIPRSVSRRLWIVRSWP